MNNNHELKQVVIDEIKSKVQDAKSLIFVTYEGTNVAQDTALRNAFRENNCEYKVYKNKLIARALNELGMTGYEQYLKGATSLAFGQDEIAPCQVVEKMKADNKNLEAKFGIINGKYVDFDTVVRLGKLPSKEVLIAQLLSMLNAPVRGLAVALNEIAKKN